MAFPLHRFDSRPLPGSSHHDPHLEQCTRDAVKLDVLRDDSAHDDPSQAAFMLLIKSIVKRARRFCHIRSVSAKVSSTSDLNRWQRRHMWTVYSYQTHASRIAVLCVSGLGYPVARRGATNEANNWAHRLGVVGDEPWKVSMLAQFLSDLKQHGGEVPEPHTLPPVFTEQQKDIRLRSLLRANRRDFCYHRPL